MGRLVAVAVMAVNSKFSRCGMTACVAAVTAIIALAGHAAETTVTRDNAATFYRDFTRLTPELHRVPPAIWLLCRLPVGKEQEALDRRAAGIHYGLGLHVYANPRAASVIDQRTPVFPTGTTIVKEKHAGNGLGGTTISAIGGMIKRAPGYDTANGDWEYFYFGGANEFATGRISTCIECHRAAKARDYVYSHWNAQRRR